MQLKWARDRFVLCLSSPTYNTYSGALLLLTTSQGQMTHHPWSFSSVSVCVYMFPTYGVCLGWRETEQTNSEPKILFARASTPDEQDTMAPQMPHFVNEYS